MRRKYSKNNQTGFIAIITAILLSLILIIVTVTLNQSGYFTRGILLESEYKEMSAGLAEACFEIAKLRLANNPSYIANNDLVNIGSNECTIRLTQPGIPTGQITISTQAKFREATTNLRIRVNESDKSVISWQELPSF